MKNERINLTPGFCRDLKPKDKLYYVYDKNCPGLWLWIYPSGFKTWYYHYRPRGRQTTNIKLGRFEMLNPAQAANCSTLPNLFVFTENFKNLAQLKSIAIITMFPNIK